MSDEQLLVTLGVQDKGANKQISALNKELRYLDKEFKTTAKGSKDFEKTQEGLKTKLTYLEKKYDVQKNKIEAYNKKLQESKEKAEKKKEELEKLKVAEGDNTKAIEKAEKQLETYQNQMRTATQNINLTEIELKNLKKDIDSTNEALRSKALEEYKSQMKSVSKTLEESGEKIKKVGDGVTKFGKGASVATAGIVAAGAAGVASYKEVKVGLDNVIKATGATGEAAKGLEKTYKNIASNSGDDFGSIGSALGEVNTRFGFTEKKAEDCTKAFLEFARINNTDATTSVQLVSRAMGDAGIKADDYGKLLDELSAAAQASGISIDKLTENLTKYGAPMRALGFDTKESIAIFSSWEKAGVNTEIAFSGMKKAISNWSSAGKDARKEFKRTLDEIAKCPNIASATTKAIEIFEQKAGPDLADAIKGGRFQYEDFLKIIEGSEGTVKKTFNQITDGTEDAAKAMNNAKLASAELGKTIMIAATPIMKELSKQVKAVSEWFQGLDQTTKENIVRVAAFTATVGPAALMVGKLTSGIGSLVSGSGKAIGKLIEFTSGTKKVKAGAEIAKGGVGALTKGIKILNPVTIGVTAAVAGFYGAMKVGSAHAKIMSKDILYTTDQMSGLEKAVAKFSNTGSKSKEELISMGLVYKDFSKNISPEFQKKVVESTNKINEFNMKLTEVNIDGKITKKEAEELKNRVTNMCEGAISAIKSKQEESNKAMKELFLRDGVLDQSEKEMLESIKRNNNNQINEVNKLKKEILSIEQQALKEKRGLTEEEVKLIREKNNRIAQIELEAMGKSHEEMIYAQNEFQNRLNNISLEDASNLMKEKAKLRDEEYNQIKSAYDTKITLLEEHMAKADGKERENFKKEIETLKGERDQKLQTNRELYDGYLNTVKEKNPEIAAEINKFNGETLTAQDKTSQQLLEKIKSSYDGINQITESGNYLLVNKNTQALESVSVKVDEKTGEIVGMYEEYSGHVGGYTTAVADEVKKMGEAHDVTAVRIRNSLNDMENNTIDSAGNIVNANGQIVWSLQDVKRNTDGTREGVLNLNGTPINIKADANGAIRNLDEVKNKIDNIPQNKSFTITGFIDWATDKVKGFFGFAEGTNYAPQGVHMVGEEGYEIAQKGNKLGIVGINGPEFRRFRGGEKIIPHNKSVNMLKDVITSGGYFSPNSIQSKELISNVTNNFNNSYTNNSNITNRNNTDMEKIIRIIGNELGSAIVNSMARCMQNANINLNADLNGLANTVTPGVRSNISRTQKSRNIARGEL